MNDLRTRFNAWVRKRGYQLHNYGFDYRPEAYCFSFSSRGPCGVFDHAFVACRFPVWGGEMFDEAPVEYVLLGEPYLDPPDLRDILADTLDVHGWKTWVLDDLHFHNDRTTLFVAAAVDPVQTFPIISMRGVAGQLDLDQACGFYTAEQLPVHVALNDSDRTDPPDWWADDRVRSPRRRSAV